MSDPTVLSPFPFALVPVTHSGNEVSPPEYRDRYYEHSGSSQDISFFQHPVEVYDQQIVFSKGYFSIGILKKRVWWWRTRDKKMHWRLCSWTPKILLSGPKVCTLIPTSQKLRAVLAVGSALIHISAVLTQALCGLLCMVRKRILPFVSQ